jgi:Uma2 family endonuclease
MAALKPVPWIAVRRAAAAYRTPSDSEWDQNRNMISVEELEEFRYELDEGKLITMTRPRASRARIERKLVVALQTFLDGNPVGEVFAADILFVLGPTTKRAPDVSVVLSPT